jgi:hypothetical protein
LLIGAAFQFLLWAEAEVSGALQTERPQLITSEYSSANNRYDFD